MISEVEIKGVVEIELVRVDDDHCVKSRRINFRGEMVDFLMNREVNYDLLRKYESFYKGDKKPVDFLDSIPDFLSENEDVNLDFIEEIGFTRGMPPKFVGGDFFYKKESESLFLILNFEGVVNYYSGIESSWISSSIKDKKGSEISLCCEFEKSERDFFVFSILSKHSRLSRKQINDLELQKSDLSEVKLFFCE